ncbi:MAG: hypothetical protein ACT4QD_19190 [Acidobacteriota bacterium]
MDTERTDDVMSDEALAGEIERALDVDPSPEFLARVRTRIASEPAASGWGLSWRVVGAGALAATVLVALVVTRPERPSAPALPAEAAVATPIVESSPAGSPVAPPSPRATASAPPLSSPGPVQLLQATPAVGPDVSISHRHLAALAALMERIREGRIDPTALNVLQTETTALEPLDTIDIHPIVFEPLPRLALLEGERP